MKNYNRLAAVMCVNIFTMHCATSSANEEDVSLHALLNVDRLENIMNRQPAAHSGPTVRLPSGRVLTANGLREAIRPLVESKPADLEPLIEALSDPRVEVRWGSAMALEGITGRRVAFYHRSEVGSNSHFESVGRWKRVIEEEKSTDIRMLLNIDRLLDIRDKRSKESGGDGPVIRLKDRTALTLNVMREAIQPLTQSQPADLASLVDALSDRREEVR